MSEITKLSIHLLLHFLLQPMEDEAEEYLCSSFNCSKEQAREAYLITYPKPITQ